MQPHSSFSSHSFNFALQGWDNCCNISIFTFETASNIQTLSKDWNKKTSLWLTRYVYMRTGGSLIAVYGMSAFWHGFYPGYYMFFMSVPLLTLVERLGRKKISPRFSSEPWSLYDISCKFYTTVSVQYMVSTFPLLALEWSWNNWKAHYFFGHVGAILLYGVLMNTPTPKQIGDGKSKKA